MYICLLYFSELSFICFVHCATVRGLTEDTTQVNAYKMMVDENELEEGDVPQDEVEHEEYQEEEEEIESNDPDTKIFLVKETTCPDETDAELLPLSPVPVYKHDGLQSYMDVLVLLKNLNPHDERLTRVPPQRPVAAGQVKIYNSLKQNPTFHMYILRMK